MNAFIDKCETAVVPTYLYLISGCLAVLITNMACVSLVFILCLCGSCILSRRIRWCVVGLVVIVFLVAIDAALSYALGEGRSLDGLRTVYVRAAGAATMVVTGLTMCEGMPTLQAMAMCNAMAPLRRLSLAVLAAGRAIDVMQNGSSKILLSMRIRGVRLRSARGIRLYLENMVIVMCEFLDDYMSHTAGSGGRTYVPRPRLVIDRRSIAGVVYLTMSATSAMVSP